MASKFRPFHKDICFILDRNPETFLRLAFSLFGAGIIEEQSKTAIIRQKGLVGADQLLTCVHGYLEEENRLDRLDIVLRLFESEEVLRNVTSRIKTKEGSVGSEGESSAGTDEVLSRPVLHTGCQQHQPLQLPSAAVTVKKDFSSPAVERDVFIEELSQDQRWYTVGVLLGVPTHKLDTISINYGSSGIRECLGELYKCCMELEGGVSWEQIVEALRKMDNGFLAGIIYVKYISPSPLLESEDSVQNRAKQVEVPDEVVQGFNNLSLQFSKLKHNVRQSIRQSNINVDDLKDVISDECSLEPLSGKESTVDNFLNRLSQYYSLLDVRVLEFLFKTFFDKGHPVQRQLTEYIELLDKFKSSAEMEHLVHLLKHQQTVNSGHKLVELKVREIWSSFTVKKFGKVLRAILKTKYSYTSQMTVQEGRIFMRPVISDIDTSKLISPQPVLCSFPDDVFTQEEAFKNTDSELKKITDTLRPEDEHIEIQRSLLTENLKQKGRLNTTGTDQEKIHNVQSSLDELKAEFDGLNSIFSQVEETPETKQDDDEESHQKSTVIPTSILKEMKVTSEKIVYFKGSEGCSLDWEEYGCKLHIPKGAIKEEEEGKLHVYAIYAGPFQFPKGMELVSGIYYISLSHHELMKPATLEIQHCSDCTFDKSSKSGLSFITIPDTTSGPPYSFEIIEGGSFSANENYGMIRRSHFCGFAVAFNRLLRLFGYGLSPNDESSSNEAEKTSEKHSSLGILHFLIANTTKKSCVILYLIKHLDLHKQHIEKQLTFPKKNIVDRKLKKITLKDKAVQVAVSEAEKNSTIINWNGYPYEIVSQWQISSESTGDSLMLHPDEIEEMLAPSFTIQIDWIGGGMIVGKYSHQFRIHILGIQGAYSFPVPVPLVPFSFSSSVCSVASYSIIDEEEEVLRDPPLLKEFLVHVVKKLCCGSDKLAVHLLNEDSRKNYIRAVKTQGREDDKDYTILFEEWKRKGTECTWQKIINALESVGENTLANNLKESYKNTSEVFLQ